MPYVRQIVAEKANIINHNKKIYGTFAEIGAGQEVVNHFFKAGLASQTVAKSMSAYDMVFSDHIYGKAGRYVCEKRLLQMLNHEFSLLKSRLQGTKGKQSCFFAFSDTVAVSTFKTGILGNHHGWMGLKFQSKPMQRVEDEIVMHVNLKDRTRLQQYEVLGALGVNLIYTAFYNKKQTPLSFISSLVDNFEKNRVEIDVLKCKGPSFKKIGNYPLNKELLNQNMADFLVFTPCAQAHVDIFYEKPIILYSLKSVGKVPPIHKSAVEFCAVQNTSKKPTTPKHKDFILYNSPHIYDLVCFIRRYTSQEIFLYMTFEELCLFLNEKMYAKKGKTMMQALGKLFDQNTRIVVDVSKQDLFKSRKLNEWGKVLVHKGWIISKQ